MSAWIIVGFSFLLIFPASLLGRLAETNNIKANDFLGTALHTESYQYDQQGRNTDKITPNGTLSYTYDAAKADQTLLAEIRDALKK